MPPSKKKATPKPRQAAGIGEASGKKATVGAKQVAPPASTGGRGNAFESRVQAHRLLALCTNSTSCPGIPEGFRIVGLRFQDRVFGSNTDDLTCFIEDGYGKKGRVRLQMKRTLQPKLADTSFKEAVGLAWLDFKSPTFKPLEDFFNIVYDVVSAQGMKAAAELARDAVRSISAESWEIKATAANFSNDTRRAAFQALQAIVDEYNQAPVSKEEFFLFMQHVQFMHEDLDSDETAGAKALQDKIEFVTRVSGRPPLPPATVWAKLIAVCVDLNGCAGEVNHIGLAAQLGSDLEYRFKAFSLSASITLPQANSCDALQRASTSSLPVFTPAAAPALAPMGAVNDLVPVARDSSVNKLVSRMLDRVSDLIKGCKFQNAREELQRIRRDTEEEPLDAHQEARWFSMHGTCVWTLDDDAQAAAEDFIKAAELFEDDDKLAAARVRGLLLKSQLSEAIAAAKKALDRFPTSLAVWVSWINARILGGETVSEADILNCHAAESVAYQMVAAGLHKAGNVEGAFEVASKGLALENASFFVRDAVLRYALELATASPVYVAYRVAPAPRVAALRRAVDEFSPRDSNLWATQAPQALTSAARHLAYAYLLLGEPQQALEVTQEGLRHSVDNQALLRPRLEALRDLGRAGEALSVGAPLLDSMPLDALVAFADTAANEGDAERLAQAVTKGLARLGEDTSGTLAEALKGLQWELLLRQGLAMDVKQEATEQGVLDSGCVPLLTLGARACLQLQDAENANKYLAKTVEAVQADSDPANQYLLAQLMMQAERYAEAAEYYEKILPGGAISELHTHLLFCYIRLGLRAKARDLLASFPAHWRKNRLARHLATELGQQAGDWVLLQTLVAPQLEAEGNLATSWLFALTVAAHCAEDSVDAVVAQFPRVLEGSILSTTQVASAELQHNRTSSGLARLYRMRRLNLDSTDAAAALYSALALAPERIAQLHAQPESVDIGTSVQVGDSSGALRWKTLDPAGFDDLPPTDEFTKAASAEARPLLGKRVGEMFVVTDAMGTSHPFTVTAVINAYHRLMALSSAALQAPVVPSKHLTSFSLGTTADGGPDVEPILRQLKKKEASTAKLFKDYQEQALTLGMLARLLGTDILDLVRGWPCEKGPLLLVSAGSDDESDAVLTLLQKNPRLLVDLSALTELALTKQLHLLQGAQRPLVTAATRDIVLQSRAEGRILKPAGSARAQGGQFQFVEYTDESRAQSDAFLSAILDAVAQHCDVVPAYGPNIVPVQLPRLAAAISHEEHAVLLAALEHDAVCLTLDARLRMLASMFQIQSCWPQVFLKSKVGPALSLRDYSVAVLEMFSSRRNFITLNAHDLLVLTDQGQVWLNIGFSRLQEHLASPEADFEKAWSVTREYLEALFNRGQCQLGAVLEFFMYLLEGLLRHPHCPRDFANKAVAELGLTWDEKKDTYSAELLQFSRLAVAKLKFPVQPVTVRANVLYCSAPPAVQHGLREGPDPF